MKILLVEDEDSKRQQILQVVLTEYPRLEVVEARSLRGAEDAMDLEEFAVVVLDMSLPTFDIGFDEHGGRPQALGGRELLRYMKRYGVKAPALVLTQFNTFGSGQDALTLSQLDASLKAEDGAHYLGAVFFDSASDQWKTDLITKLQQLEPPLSSQ